MPSAIRERLEIFRDISGRPWVRVLGLMGFFVGAWDLILSQFVPEEYSRHFPKLYQAVGMTAGWLSLWVWLMLGALLVVAGAVEWAFRHKKRYLELLHQAPIPVGDQANFISAVVDHPLTGDDELNGCDKLYEEYGKELRLRFLPDTDDQASDALLLICYGYKIIRNADSIPAKFVNRQIDDLLQHAPNTREPSIYRLYPMVFALNERDFGGKCVSQGTIERIGLSKGGFYRLTRWGEEKARNLARDLINRA